MVGLLLSGILFLCILLDIMLNIIVFWRVFFLVEGLYLLFFINGCVLVINVISGLFFCFR